MKIKLAIGEGDEDWIFDKATLRSKVYDHESLAACLHDVCRNFYTGQDSEVVVCFVDAKLNKESAPLIEELQRLIDEWKKKHTKPSPNP